MGVPGGVSRGSHGDTLQRGDVPDVSLSYSVSTENAVDSVTKRAERAGARPRGPAPCVGGCVLGSA